MLPILSIFQNTGMMVRAWEAKHEHLCWRPTEYNAIVSGTEKIWKNYKNASSQTSDNICTERSAFRSVCIHPMRSRFWQLSMRPEQSCFRPFWMCPERSFFHLVRSRFLRITFLPKRSFFCSVSVWISLRRVRTCFRPVRFCFCLLLPPFHPIPNPLPVPFFFCMLLSIAALRSWARLHLTESTEQVFPAITSAKVATKPRAQRQHQWQKHKEAPNDKSGNKSNGLMAHNDKSSKKTWAKTNEYHIRMTQKSQTYTWGQNTDLLQQIRNTSTWRSTSKDKTKYN